jgi:TatD DNase family protein
MLVETDSPYLAPVPHRGRTNEPAYVTAVGEALARAIERPVDELRERTNANAHLVFGLADG